jgi:hypothetical protein
MSSAQVQPQSGGTAESAAKNPAAEEGPTENRSCTDILCLLLYAAALVLFWILFSYGLANGDPSRLLSVYDASNRSCGYDIPDKPYLYFPLPLPGSLNISTCVSQCPSGNPLPESLDCDVSAAVPNCTSTLASINWESILLSGGINPLDDG